MSVSSEQIAAHCDEDHGVRDIDAPLIVAHQASPAHHPSEGTFDHPPARQNLEALLVVGPADDLDDKIEIGRFIHQVEPIVGAIGEQMLDPRPALADGTEDHVCSALAGMSAVVRLTINNRPSVSTAMCRLRPTIFLPAS